MVTWMPHIQYIRKKVALRLKLLKTLAASKYGSDQNFLLKTFTSTVVSVIEFGSPAYGSARSAILEQLQTVFNEGLRIALGVFKTTRTAKLLTEAGLKNVETRRSEKTAALGLRMLSIRDHPLRQRIQSPEQHQHYINRQRQSRPFAVRAGLSRSGTPR